VVDFALGLVLDHFAGLPVNADFLDMAALLDVERIAPAAAFIFIFARDDLAGGKLERAGALAAIAPPPMPKAATMAIA
jgi:hypothetical protein